MIRSLTDPPCWNSKSALLVPLLLLTCSLPIRAEEPAELPPPEPVQGPVSPQDSLKYLELHPDLRIELVACEPQVIDPVEIAFDEDGRLWVVQYTDYPNGPQAGEKPRSKIVQLFDKDGDGFYESSQTFADELLWVCSLMPFRGGLIVTMAGEVAFLRDTDGDGKADVHETWFTGFAEQNPQLRANHPTFGLDNYIYIANGLRGGDVIARRPEWSKDAEAVSISGMDFRFDPLSGKYDAITGVGQYGLTFDDFGNRFVCSNRNPCKHIVLENRYLKRNKVLGVRTVYEDVAPDGAHSHVFPISQAWTTSTLHAGQFTACSGVLVYRGDALPEKFRGNSFLCESTGNLVHRDVLSAKGATFTSQYGRQGVEFLASRDNWFRAVNLTHGPDGAMYVADMYRAVIEHPDFMPVELKNRPDLNLGNDRGRIYRIVAKNAPKADQARRKPNLSQTSTAELVALFEHPNSWQQETAARLIYERQDRSVSKQLAAMVSAGKSATARVHALWALQGLGSLQKEQVATGLNDSDPRVQEQAVRLSEPFLSGDEAIRTAVIKLADAQDARLRFQVALSLGECAERQEVLSPLAQIALASGADSWTRIAVLSSIPETPREFLAEVIGRLRRDARETDVSVRDLVEQTAELIGTRRQDGEIQETLKLVGDVASDRQELSRLGRELMGIIEGVGRGLARRGQSINVATKKSPSAVRDAVGALFALAAQVATDQSQSAADRLQGISTLRYADYELAGAVLKKLSFSNEPQDVRLAVIDVWSGHHDAEIGPQLLANFDVQTPVFRRAVLDALLARNDRITLLLDEIEAKRISVTELNPTQINRLKRNRDAKLKNRASQLIASAISTDRAKVIDEYRSALTKEADPDRGREVFARNCANCHRIGDLGTEVAPDIADSRTKTPEYLLTSILDPNRAIDANYYSFTVVTLQGKVYTGIIAAETALSITLKQPEGKADTILRDEIDEFKSNGISLMPEGLEKTITVDQMADLIRFVKNWRYMDGKVPLGTTSAP